MGGTLLTELLFAELLFAEVLFAELVPTELLLRELGDELRLDERDELARLVTFADEIINDRALDEAPITP